jgi:hypothetical protein
MSGIFSKAPLQSKEEGGGRVLVVEEETSAAAAAAGKFTCIVDIGLNMVPVADVIATTIMIPLIVWFILSFTSIYQFFLSLYLRYAHYYLKLILSEVIDDAIICSNN